MKVLQVNIGRGRDSFELAVANAKNWNVDLILFQEPNVNIAKRQNFLCDINFDTAIFGLNKNLGILNHETMEGCVKLNFENWSLYNVYLSPNIRFEEFQAKIDNIMSDIRMNNKMVIISGDMNSKSSYWGSPTTNNRGLYVEEWMASLDLYAENRNGVPTFVRRNSETVIDVTIYSNNFRRRIKSWRVVEEEESLSHHKYIVYEIEFGILRKANKIEFKENVRIDKNIFGQTLELLRGEDMDEPDFFVDKVKEAQELAAGVRRNRRVNAYWWSDEIADVRNECNNKRRMLQRARRRNGTLDDLDELHENYKEAKKQLKLKIYLAKKNHWENLINNLENDPWGQGYKIITNKLKRTPNQYGLDFTMQKDVILELFPPKLDRWLRGRNDGLGIPFLLDELKFASKKLNKNKSPGPDGILPESVKLAVETFPNEIL